MKKEKIENYNLTGSIHTLQVRSPGEVAEPMQEVQECIAASSRTEKGQKVTTAIINPNKLIGDCFQFSDFTIALETILTGAGIENYSIMRADLRLDSYDPEHYHLYSKLNKLLISALAVKYKVKNAYKTNNLFSQEQLSVAIKNDYFHCENYNRREKSKLTKNHTEAAESRLEERTTPRSWRLINSKRPEKNANDWNLDALRQEFLIGWRDRWSKAITTENLLQVQKCYNDELEKIYKRDKGAYPCRFRSLTDFLIQYQDCIFCKAQMIDLLSRFPEVESPELRAKYHKKKYGIEYFSLTDLRKAVKEIDRATQEFFSK